MSELPWEERVWRISIKETRAIGDDAEHLACNLLTAWSMLIDCERKIQQNMCRSKHTPNYLKDLLKEIRAILNVQRRKNDRA